MQSSSGQDHGPAERHRGKPCPCKQDENRQPAFPGLTVAGKTFAPDLSLVGGFWPNDLTIDVPILNADRVVHEFRSQDKTGREILRALHILRC
jgi:hypothetical protein